MDAAEAPYRSYDVIANTSGYDAYIDGHSHTQCGGETVTDKNGKPVLVAQTGSALATVGEMKLSKNSNPQSKLLKTLGEKSAPREGLCRGARVRERPFRGAAH